MVNKKATSHSASESGSRSFCVRVCSGVQSGGGSNQLVEAAKLLLIYFHSALRECGSLKPLAAAAPLSVFGYPRAPRSVFPASVVGAVVKY
jgi:hypothetical protein